MLSKWHNTFYFKTQICRLTALTLEHIFCSVNQQFEMLPRERVMKPNSFACRHTMRGHVTIYNDEQPSRAARVTQRRAATVSLITAERIAVLFTGCECEILGLRLMTSQQLNWIYALVFPVMNWEEKLNSLTSYPAQCGACMQLYRAPPEELLQDDIMEKYTPLSCGL